MNATNYDMDLRSYKNLEERRKGLEEKLNIALPSIGKVFIDELDSVHCENLIGSISIPVGVAGPLHVKGEYSKGTYYVPLATTEGALVASVNRGCKAILQSSGATTRLEHVGTTRGPVFTTSGIAQALSFKKWLAEHFDDLKKIAESTSTHLTLLKIGTRILGKEVYVRFYFDTEDAMGMNMVTIATDAICSFIVKEQNVECPAVAGNFDIDKKPAWLNFISGRGRRGWAEVTLTKQVVEEVLKTTPEVLYNIVIKKCWGGSIMSGSLGFNAHFANITAAFFAATGQDIAHVVEGSQGITSAEVLENGDLYFSVYMPDIMLGTVGGGTKLKTQTEARSIMGVTKVEELSEIFVASVLAGELSLLASIAEKSLAKTHQKLGR